MQARERSEEEAGVLVQHDHRAAVVRSDHFLQHGLRGLQEHVPAAGVSGGPGLLLRAVF